MRIEKGHPAGNELSGQTTAHDLGFGKLLSTKKDFIGRFMAARPALTDPDAPDARRASGRWTATTRLRGGAHFVPRDAAVTAENDQGYVTSVAFSPSLGHWVGLGLLARGPERHGEVIRAADPLRGADVHGRGLPALLHRSGRSAAPCLTGSPPTRRSRGHRRPRPLRPEGWRSRA